ncbi:MAG: hypothetical protein HY000_34525 [Planctomycetes bacterium]|nr:hypothetical protein [Planctomycetota bacterium]
MLTAADPDKSETAVLQTMCDKGMAIAKEMGANAIDVQRSMRTIQRRVWAENERIKEPDRKLSMHAADGVHLNELGQLAMAFAILKGLGAPADVSSATVDFETVSATEASGCRISDVKADDAGLEFTRLDDGLPINFGLFGALNFRFVPFHTELNRTMLMVRNLPAGKYLLSVDGREVGKYAHNQLAKGVNISSATSNAWQPGGPWDAQATAAGACQWLQLELGDAQGCGDGHPARLPGPLGWTLRIFAPTHPPARRRLRQNGKKTSTTGS